MTTPIKVHVMTAEHFEVPGIRMKVCASQAHAFAEALSCVNDIRADAGLKPVKSITSDEDIEKAMAPVQDTYGAANCYVDITECDIIGEIPWSERSPKQWAMIQRINSGVNGERWALFVCGDGMIVAEWDADQGGSQPSENPLDFIEDRARAGSLLHQIALGLHGMTMTEEQ